MEPAAQHRLFVALSVPEPIRREIEREQAELKQLMPVRMARWSNIRQLHLTLRFLGNVEVSRIPELIPALNAACGSFAPVKLQAAGLGFFPEIRSPRVGVCDNDGQLSRLWAAVHNATRVFSSEEPEKSFSAHITLARLSRSNRHEAEAFAKTVQARQHKVFGEWTAHGVELVHSQLSPQGARHERVAAVDLLGN